MRWPAFDRRCATYAPPATPLVQYRTFARPIGLLGLFDRRKRFLAWRIVRFCPLRLSHVRFWPFRHYVLIYLAVFGHSHAFSRAACPFSALALRARVRFCPFAHPFVRGMANVGHCVRFCCFRVRFWPPLRFRGRRAAIHWPCAVAVAQLGVVFDSWPVIY